MNSWQEEGNPDDMSSQVLVGTRPYQYYSQSYRDSRYHSLAPSRYRYFEIVIVAIFYINQIIFISYWYRDEVLDAFRRSRQESRLKQLEDEVLMLKDKEQVNLLFEKKK